MKTNEKLAKELKDAVSNIHGMNYLVDKGIVMFKPETRCVEVHYLLWHTFSKQGLVKLLPFPVFQYGDETGCFKTTSHTG